MTASPARSTRKGRTISTLAASLAAATCLGIVGTAVPASASTPGICPPQVASQSAAHLTDVDAQATDLVLEFIKAAGKGVGGKAFNFALSQLLGGGEDRTPEQLDAIAKQLATMDAKLDNLQKSADEIKAAVNEAAFTNMMMRFKDLKADVESINHNGLVPVALAADNLAKVKANPESTPEQIAAAKECVSFQRSNFLTLAGMKGADNNVNKIYNLLSSDAGEDHLVNGYGKLITQNNRLLVTKHSEQLRAFYDYMEQYLALAAIQKAEWQVGTGRPDVVIEASNKQFTNDDPNKPGMIQTLRGALPKPIPATVSIDAGQGGDRVVGKTMIMSVGGPKSTWRDADRQGHSTGDSEIVKRVKNLNSGSDSRGLGLKDWKVITPDEWNTLLQNKPANQGNIDFLNWRLSDQTTRHFGFNDKIWIGTDAHNQTMNWVNKDRNPRSGVATYPTHLTVTATFRDSLATTGPTAAWSPVLPWQLGKVENSRVAKQFVDKAFNDVKGNLVVSRTVVHNYMGTN